MVCRASVQNSHLEQIYNCSTNEAANQPLNSDPYSIIITKTNKTNSVTFSQQANYTDWATATGRHMLVPTFVDRGVSRGQRSRSPSAVKLRFLDHSRNFFFK
jgi:hypothetical protein